MNNPLKSFSELGDIYMNKVVLTESKKNTDDDLGFKKAGKQKDDGPEAADGFKKKTVKVEAKKKVTKESTQTSSTNMETKKLSFDELYERALNEGPDSLTSPVADELAPAAGDNMDAPTDTNPFAGEGDDVGATDEVVDPKELFASICDAVDKLKAHFGIDDTENVDDVDGEVGADDGAVTDIEDIEPTKESVETEELPDSKGQSLQNKNNKVSAVKVVKKKAETGKVTNDPEPKALGDKGGSLTGKNNKVSGSGAQSKVGASAFES